MIRLRVFFGTLSGLINPIAISEWWISTSGGLSVTKDIHTTDNCTFTLEQLLSWNPEVIVLRIMNNENDLDASLAYTDSRYASISAVQNKRIYLCPKGVHHWAAASIEHSNLLWEVQKFIRRI
jgi:iron complex transport system substrate-binding protein